MEFVCIHYVTGVTIEAPTNVNISYDDEHNGFKCSWSPPNDSSKILRYNLTCEGSDGSLNTWRINKNKTQTVLTGLSQCLSYKVGIRSDSMHSCSEYNYVWINASSICGAAMYKANKCADSHKSPYPFISYNDSILPNNSYVNVHRGGGVTIGCHTNLRTCCNRHAGSGRGDWYDPDGNRLPFYSEGQISQKRMSSQQVNLYHPGSKRSLGVYCCEIETNAVNGCDRESVCVGLYNGNNYSTVNNNYKHVCKKL